MTDKRSSKPRKLAHEILGLIAISALLAGLLFWILANTATTVAEVYCFENDVAMTEFDWMEVERWIFSLSAILSVVAFGVLFLALLGDRIDYIGKLTQGIHDLRMGKTDAVIPLEGSDELTELADAINYMSAAQRQLREKEENLAQEKEQLIRTLSHDIRTPLTSVLAYSEYLATEEVPPQEQKAHLRMIRKKAEQIRDLTDILLEGGRRSPEKFDDAHLLMEQLAAEFEEGLEDRFQVRTDLTGCPSFAGSFDVQELRRIFDNLSSNIQKYAEPTKPVSLTVSLEHKTLVIRQTNAIHIPQTQQDSYGLGIRSIQRIAQHYGGRASVQQDTNQFAITIVFSDF